jgi:hypothetical protein
VENVRLPAVDRIFTIQQGEGITAELSMESGKPAKNK